MKKRLLSMAMALVMTLSLLPGAMFAAPAGTGSVAVDSKTFPDAKFLAYVQTLPGAEDGVFTQAELDKITEIDCGDYPYDNINNMKGVEVFGKLEKLVCGNDLVSLDLSHNLNLVSLSISSTEITKLDLSHNQKLVELDFNNPDAVDLSQVPQLKSLGYYGNKKLDLSHHQKLEELRISGTDGVDLRQVPQLKKLTCFNADTLDLSHNPKLTSLSVNRANITSLDLSYNPELTHLHMSWCEQLTSLDLSHNPKLTSIELAKLFGLTEMNLSQNSELRDLSVTYSCLTKLDVSHNPKLTNFIIGGFGADASVAEVDVSGNPNLTKLDVFDTKISELDLSHNPKLRELGVSSRNLKNLDVSHNPELTILAVGWSGVTSLDVTHNPNLTEINIYGTKISELDISRNPKLETVINEDAISLLLPREGIKASVLEIPEDAQFAGCSVTADGMLAFDEGVDEASYKWQDYQGDRVQILKRHPKGYFPDVKPGAWFYNGVTYSAGKGLMSGLPDGTFGPSVTMTRAQLVQMLYALEGKPDVAITGKFSDVKSGDWFAKAVSWAVKAGVTGGVGDGTTFAPNNKITRQEMAVMLYAYMGRPATEGKLDFVDNADIAGWAGKAVVWVVDNGLMGSASTVQRQFAPKNTATRAEAAVIMMNLDKMLSE